MYLISQMWWYLLLAFLLGAFIGYLLWRTCNRPLLEAGFERSKKKLLDRIAVLEGGRPSTAGLVTGTSGAALHHAGAVESASAAEAKIFKKEAADRAVSASNAAAPVLAAAALATKPGVLSAPRGGKADDLKLIWGVGPKIEKVLNTSGYYHFDQIAQWTEKEAVWIDGLLGEDTSRVSRDKWVEQCKKLATGWRPDNPAGDNHV
jgi:NADH-quinone oxidoreductase subunit E